MYTKEFQSKQITKQIGNITDITHFVPDFFEINIIHEKIVAILEKKSESIKNNLLKLNFAELSEMIKLLELNLLAQDVEIYKKYLALDGGISVNIDYGNKCSFACSHCSIEGNKNGTDINLEEIKKYFSNFSTFENTIKDIEFANGGEIFERDNFDEIFKYFLERGIKSFSMISRGINEKNQKKYNEKQDIIKNKIKKLKEDFPDFDLKIGISVDNFSRLNFGKLIYNTLFLFDLNSIFNNKHLYFSCTHDIKNKEETNNLINSTIYYLEKYIQLGKSTLLFNLISNDMLIKINKIINLGSFESAGNDGKRNHFYKHNKNNLFLQFDYTTISDDGRGKKQLKKSIKSLDKKADISEEKKTKYPNYGEFSCMPLNNPKKISIQKGGNIKTCSATHLKYQKEFNYNNINGLTEEEFIEKIAINQSELYKNIGIEEIIKLIESKRKGNFICMNNMLKKN